MPLFAYKARDLRGLLIQGRMEGLAAEVVKHSLNERGLIPIQVKPIGKGGDWIPKLKFFKKVKNQELLLMTRQFYTLFKAGMSMESILTTLARQTNNQIFKETLQRVQTDISQGASLAQAFGKHPQIFNELYTNMLSAGEEAGILEEVLKNLGELLQKEIEIKAGIKSATLYPKIVVGVLFTAINVMLVWVVPKFAAFYTHYKAELPLPTRLLTLMSSMVRDYFIFFALGIGIILILLHRYYHTPQGRLRLDRFRFKIPVFGPLAQMIANARFANLIASLYQSGMSITKCLGLVETTIENEVMAKDIRRVRTEIERGQSIANGMRQTTCFAPLLIEACAVGEKTGSLDETLKGLASHFEMEVAHTVKNLTTLLEPILLTVIFGMVAFFALAIFLPIWNISQAVMH